MNNWIWIFVTSQRLTVIFLISNSLSDAITEIKKNCICFTLSDGIGNIMIWIMQFLFSKKKTISDSLSNTIPPTHFSTTSHKKWYEIPSKSSSTTVFTIKGNLVEEK